MIDGLDPGGKAQVPVSEDHELREPRGPHWQPPSERLVGWSIVVAAAATVVILALTVMLVLLAEH